MKVIILILILSLSVLPGKKTEFSSPQAATEYVIVSASDVRLNVKGRVLYLDTLLFTGKVVEKDLNDVVNISTEYMNGLQHGLQVSYYPNGKMNEERLYQFGKKEGEHKGWWENGSIRFIYHFKNDVFEGNVRMWNEKGMLFNDFNYIKGQESGMQKSWFENGMLRANYEVKNNRKYGLTGVKNCKSVTNENTN